VRINHLIAAVRRPQPRIGGFAGINALEYRELMQFSRAAEEIGIEPTSIDHGPSGLGAVLQLSSSTRDYELSICDGLLRLSVMMPEGIRCKLCEGASRLENTWAGLLATLKLHEQKMEWKSMLTHEPVARALLKAKGKHVPEFFGLSLESFKEVGILGNHCEKQLGLTGDRLDKLQQLRILPEHRADKDLE
jgi:hypothetical protein